MDKRKIISFGVSTGPYSRFVEAIAGLGRERQSSYVCVANVHMVIEAWRDREFARVVEGAEIVTPDGMPLVKALRLLYGVRQERVAGMDLMPSLLAAAEREGLAVYLYGSTEDVLAATVARMRREHPGLAVAGSWSPPFRTLTGEEDRQAVERINGTGAHLVLVALGCPKQERWMAEHQGKINAVMIGVDGAFPVYAGLQKRAPEWMCRWSLEWLLRLLQEPGRLFKRYLVTNTLFWVLLAREIIRGRKDPPP